MRALVSHASDPVPSVEEVLISPLGPTDVRVRVAAAGITLFDLFVATDHETFGLPEAIGLGFDFSGRVLEVGAQVTAHRPGDLVAGMHVDPAAPSRAHAEEVVVSEAALGTIPTGLALESAAAVTLSALTARQALDLLGTDRGRLLVTGAAGSVGSWVVALAHVDGWVVDVLIRAASNNLPRQDGIDTVLTEMPAGGYDAVIDTAALQDAALTAVRDRGRFVGVKPGRDVSPVRGIAVSAVLVRPDGGMLTSLLQRAADGLAPIRIATRHPLKHAAEAYTCAQEMPGSAGRHLLIP